MSVWRERARRRIAELMSGAAFLAMRADLVERGLLTEEHRLTNAGHAYVEELIETLPNEEVPQRSKPGVTWRIDLAGNARRAGSAPKGPRRA